MRLLAVGVPFAEVADRISKSFKRPYSMDDLRQALARSSSLTREESLLPPVASAFLKRRLLPPAGAVAVGEAPGVELSVGDLDDLRSLAGELIDSYLAADGDASKRPDPRHVAMNSAALQYAEALLHQCDVREEFSRARQDRSSLHAMLTETDRSRVEEFLLFTGGMRLDTWLDSWERCVVWVEGNTELIVYEVYADRLGTRDRLADVTSLVSLTSRALLETRLGPLDERFSQATREVPTSIQPCSPWQPQPWWWYRVPSRLGEYFKDRLGHLSPAAARAAVSAQGPVRQSQRKAQS